MQQHRQKTVLFFSKFCGHSTEVLRAITGRDLRSAFALLCIDDADVRRRLPAYVDRVPIAFTPDRRILADDALLSYIHGGGGESSAAYNNGSTSDGAVAVAVDPVAAGLSGGTDFSWLEEQEDDGRRRASGDANLGGGAYRDRGASGSLFLTLHQGDDGDPAWHGQRIDPPPDDEQRDTKPNQQTQHYHQQHHHHHQQQQQQQQHSDRPQSYLSRQSHNQQQQQQQHQGRLMPVATFGHGGASGSVASLESLEAIREQERQSWST